MAKANDQTGLASGSALTRMHQEIALGVYSLVGPSPSQVALQGPLEAFLTVNKHCVAMMLTWPWWSLEGSLLVGACRIGHSPEKEVLVVTPQ